MDSSFRKPKFNCHESVWALKLLGKVWVQCLCLCLGFRRLKSQGWFWFRGFHWMGWVGPPAPHARARACPQQHRQHHHRHHQEALHGHHVPLASPPRSRLRGGWGRLRLCACISVLRVLQIAFQLHSLISIARSVMGRGPSQSSHRLQSVGGRRG